MLALFFAFPTFAYVGQWFGKGTWVIPLAISAGLLAAIYLARQPNFDLRHRWRGNPHSMRPILLRFGVSATLLLVATWIFIPNSLFRFPRENPGFWAAVMFGYPFLSVLGQEVVFRAFFFRRYRTVFRTDSALIWVSAGAFGIVHILFGHWQSVALSTIGGAFFAHTYVRTRSIRAVSLEHALYGNWIFTVGLGSFFYHGHSAPF